MLVSLFSLTRALSLSCSRPSILGFMREVTSALGTGVGPMMELHEALKSLQECTSKLIAQQQQQLARQECAPSLGDRPLRPPLQRKSSFLGSWKELPMFSLRSRSFSETSDSKTPLNRVSVEESRNSLLYWSQDACARLDACTPPHINLELEAAESVSQLASLLLRDQTIFVHQLRVLLYGVLLPLRESDAATQLPSSFGCGCAHLETLAEIHAHLLKQLWRLVGRLQRRDRDRDPTADSARSPAARPTTTAEECDPVAPFHQVAVARLRDCHQSYSFWVTESKFLEQLLGSARLLRRHLQARTRLVEERFPELTLTRLIRLPLDRIFVYATYVSVADSLAARTNARTETRTSSSASNEEV
jgi:hypothetical protein